MSLFPLHLNTVELRSNKHMASTILYRRTSTQLTTVAASHFSVSVCYSLQPCVITVQLQHSFTRQPCVTPSSTQLSFIQYVLLHSAYTSLFTYDTFICYIKKSPV